MAQAQSRRDFVKTSSLAGLTGVTMPYWFSSPSAFAQSTSANERLTVGCIGTGSRWNAVGPAAFKFADCVALCDVDANHLEAAKKKSSDIMAKKGTDAAGEIKTYERYQDLLEQDGIDIVTVVTPDHWHTKPVIDALQAGKDVYSEKPLTLTIHEGKQINKVLADTGRVMQVGTQQRTEMGRRFLQAIALIRQGRIGDVKKITCNIGGSSDSGEIPVKDAPEGLNWDLVAWASTRRPIPLERRRPMGQDQRPLRVPLVVRVLRRQNDRLGCPPRRHRIVGCRCQRGRHGAGLNRRAHG